MPYFLLHNMQKTGHQCSPRYTCKLAYDLLHYILHWAHMHPDMGLDTFHLYMQNWKGIHSLICIQVDNWESFRCSLASMNMQLEHQLLGIYYKARKERGHKDQWVHDIQVLLDIEIKYQNIFIFHSNKVSYVL